MKFTLALDLRPTYAYTKKMHLTPHQKAFLDFITYFREKNGFAPSQKEIAEHLGYRSLGTVQKYLVRLQKKGLLENTPNARRGLTVKRAQPLRPAGVGSAIVPLPLLGRVAAGKPIETIETDNPDQIDVPTYLVKRGEHFILEVMGHSMIEDGILEGDLVIVKTQNTAERGQMVVALIDGMATVKRFFPKKGLIELHPANPAYHPLIISPEQSFQIQGIVAGVIRKVS